MRYRTFMLAGLILYASSPMVLQAASSSKPSCRKIRDAVWAGKTLEQITAEFDTDSKTVMKCTQQKGKRKAAPRTPKKSTKGGAKSGKSPGAAGTSAEKTKSQSPTTHKPSAPRSSGRPAYQP
jgi:hypothetical protein